MTRSSRSTVVLGIAWFAIAAHGAAPPAPVVLDRLFFSVEERRALDRPSRNAPTAPSAPAVASQASPPPAPRETPPVRRSARPAEAPRGVEVEPPKVTGFVKRSSGNDTVWVNQRPQYRRTE